MVDSISVRLYDTGSVGDCILLLFYENEQVVFKMLVDCGGFNAPAAATQAAVRDILATCNNRVDLLVVTHQHLDHVSGFNAARALFDDLEVGSVWMSWVENPGDEVARILKKKYEKRLREISRQALDAQARLAQLNRSFKEYSGINAAMELRRRNLESTLELLDFEEVSFGLKAAAGATTNDAMKYVKRKGDLSYKKPGDLIEDLQGAAGVRFYILGPPRERDLKHIKIEEQHDEMYAIRRAAEDTADDGMPEEPVFPTGTALVDGHSPFREHFIATGKEEEQLQKDYNSESHKWRNIEADWLEAQNGAALALTSFVNNTSLAMAIEIVGKDQVILLPADAQSGNWISWHFPRVSAAFARKGGKTVLQLLEKTVLYKVGHHGSHNGTASKSGLDRMTNPDLVALMPLIQHKVPDAWGGEENFPAKGLYEQLTRKTNGRLARVDVGLIEEDLALQCRERLSANELNEFNGRLEVTDLYIAYTI